MLGRGVLMKFISLFAHVPIHRIPSESHPGAVDTTTAAPVDSQTRVFRGQRCAQQTTSAQADAVASQDDAPRIFRGRTCQPASALEGLNLSKRAEAVCVFRGGRLPNE